MDWSQILEAHGRIVWSTVYRLVNDEADAADCFQETFVAALEYSRSHTIRNWPGMLKRLATAKAIDRMRRRMRTSTAPLAAGAVENAVDGARSPPSIVESRELAERVRVELAALPRPQAEACCLRFLEGWTYDEIAVELNLTVNHVGVLLNRAKASLRERLMQFAPINTTRHFPEEKS
ncbi:MAG TPA: sigma-70 family RNA polymerase sigma factor [Planctomycetaceae bacterium]|jgi:RNA polymerase sigma-70 factor (ECF subfamily)